MDELILSLNHIVVDYELQRYSIRAIDDVTLNLKRGKITALVGESGSGKTTLASTILRTISDPGRLVSGQILYYPTEHDIELPNHSRSGEKTVVAIEQLTTNQLNHYRWSGSAMVFQGAQSALNPVMTVFEQFYETMRVHHLGAYNAREFTRQVEQRAKEVLSIVHLDSNRVLSMYPHELSGGMKQRVMIAFSLLLNPDLIILDEPTTALDVITQDAIFRVLKRINQSFGISMLLLTHDMGVVAKFADEVGVMYAGKLIEFGSTHDVFTQHLHPYTAGLIQATPSIYATRAQLKPIEGTPPNLLKLPSGCPFHPRCERRLPSCSELKPQLRSEKNEMVSCLLYEEETHS